MKYQFVNRKINEAGTANFPPLLKKDEPFTDLAPNIAKAYLEEKIIEPVGGASIDEAKEAELAEAKEMEVDFDTPKTESELLKMRKAKIVALAEHRGISVTPDDESIPVIAKKILEAQQGDK
jgi:hypothetical protein